MPVGDVPQWACRPSCCDRQVLVVGVKLTVEECDLKVDMARASERLPSRRSLAIAL